MGEDVVEEKTGGEANEPVGDEHEEEGDFRVLIAAQDPLNGSRDVIEELPSGAVDKKEAAKRNDGRIRAVERNDLLPEKERRGDGDGCAGECGEEPQPGVFAGKVIAARSDLVADEDGHRHGAAHGDHVDDTGKIERRLMRRDGFCAEFRDEYDDEAEEARFHEDTERIRDAERHVFFPNEEAAFR